MQKQSQSGFTIVETVISLIVVVVIVGVGYLVWHNHHKNNTATSSTTAANIGNYASPPTAAPSAPQINNASDLNSAMAALNQTSITANNVDGSQLSTESSSF